MRSLHVLAVSAVLALSGCSATTEGQKKNYLSQSNFSLSQASSCCSNFSEFNYISLSKSSSKEVEVNASAQAFLFKEGKSFFKAFELPDGINARTVRIQSWNVVPDEGAFINARFTFDPIVLFLDQNFNEIEHLSNFSMSVFQGFTMDGREASFRMTGRRSQARYMVVYTNPNRIGTDLPVKPGSAADILYELSDYEETLEVTRSAEGLINVSIRN